MSSRSIISPDDQKVTFVELFFDLVFVFSVTQVVGLLHEGIHWVSIGQGVLVFWLVWWAWTQFTWALNAADTTHPVVALGTLVATAVAFFMAVALPDAFHDKAFWFALPYVVVRSVGLYLYAWVASQNPTQKTAVGTFALLSSTGLVAVLVGGSLGGTAQYWAWGIAITLDVLAAAIAGQLEGWNLHPEHFAERHGLFVIIALGETLIVAAGGATGKSFAAALVSIAVLAVLITCALWWSYFMRTKPILDHGLESSKGPTQTRMARDSFSLLHFPMLCGVIAYAAAIEEAIVRPDEPLHLDARLALAFGLVLFVGGMAGAVYRGSRKALRARAVLSLVTAIGVVFLGGVPPFATLTVAFVGVLAIVVVEDRQP
jgi:low temperature requirement protein LtrA